MNFRRPTSPLRPHRRTLAVAGCLALLGAALPAASPAAIGAGVSAPAIIDTAAPAVDLAPVPENLLLRGGQSMTFHWTTSDAHPGTTAGDFTADIRDGQTTLETISYLETTASTDWQWTAPEMTSGYMHAVVSCRDTFGNTTTVQSGDFSVVLSTTGVPDTPPPAQPTLATPCPNPCNPGTLVRFRLPADQVVALRILAADGTRVRRLADGRFAAGDHEVYWDGRDDAGRAAASGTYLLRLVAGETAQTRKLTLVR